MKTHFKLFCGNFEVLKTSSILEGTDKNSINPCGRCSGEDSVRRQRVSGQLTQSQCTISTISTPI